MDRVLNEKWEEDTDCLKCIFYEEEIVEGVGLKQTCNFEGEELINPIGCSFRETREEVEISKVEGYIWKCTSCNTEGFEFANLGIVHCNECGEVFDTREVVK